MAWNLTVAQCSAIPRQDDFQHFAFGDIGSLEEYYGWLHNAALPGLYDSNSAYNVPDGDGGSSLTMTGKGMRVGKHNFLVGLPRLRQIRTSADSCSTESPAVVGNGDDPLQGWPCFDDTNWGTEDDDAPFTIDAAVIGAEMNEEQSTSTFRYTDAQDTLRVYGRLGYYHSGGHSVVLPANETVAVAIVEALESSNWISMNTRAVILEFHVFNRGRQLLSAVQFTLELGQTGQLYQPCDLIPSKLSTL